MLHTEFIIRAIAMSYGLRAQTHEVYIACLEYVLKEPPCFLINT